MYPCYFSEEKFSTQQHNGHGLWPFRAVRTNMLQFMEVSTSSRVYLEEAEMIEARLAGVSKG